MVFKAKQHFSDCFVSTYVNQVKGEIFDLLEGSSLDGSYDFIFLDAAQRRYLDLVKRLEEKNFFTSKTILVADNVISHNNMVDFITYISENYNCEILNIDSGFLVAKVIPFNDG